MLRLAKASLGTCLAFTLACSGGTTGVDGPGVTSGAASGTTTGPAGMTGTTGHVTDAGTVAGTNGTSSAATNNAVSAATSTTNPTGSMNGNTSGGSTNTTSGFGTNAGAGGGMNNVSTSSSDTSDTSGTSTTGTSGGPTASDVFGSCRFHFGAIDRFARDNPSIAAELDFFTPGWMGVRDTFDQGYVCDDTEPGGPLEGLVPVVVAYVAAFYAKRHNGLNDCNVGSPDLCTHGALFIKQNLSNILNVYRSYAQGYADCYGTTRPIVFEMEPDYYQYTNNSQTDPMTPQEAGSIMADFVNAIKEHLPNAVFSMDISPWVAPNNGSDHGADWYSNFDMSLFTFVHTSGGSTDASSEEIRGSNNMTWAGVSGASGKAVLADTGYGVNGSSEGHDSNWDNPQYINQRIADGVVSVSQYNPNSNWGNTIAQIRSQLDTLPGCQ